MSVTVVTNNVARDVLQGHELASEERRRFDYIDWDAVDRGISDPEFVRYRGELYDLGDTEGLPSRDLLPGWDGFISDSYFSGVCFRWPRDEQGEPDTERLICGRWYT